MKITLFIAWFFKKDMINQFPISQLGSHREYGGMTEDIFRTNFFHPISVDKSMPGPGRVRAGSRDTLRGAIPSSAMAITRHKTQGMGIRKLGCAYRFPFYL